MLGLTGYYLKFTPAFADLLRSLTQLMCKTVPFIQANQCQKPFDFLKEALMKSPILAYPDPNKPYLLFTNGSKYAWSAVLIQEHTTAIDGRIVNHQHQITDVSGLF